MRLALARLAPSHSAAAAAAFRSSTSLSSPLPRSHQLSKMASAATAKAAAAAAEPTLAPLDGPEEPTATIARINAAYASLHEAYEENFWATKMGLKVSDGREREKEIKEKRERGRRHSFFLSQPPQHPLLPSPTHYRETPRSSSRPPRRPSSPSSPTRPTSSRSRGPRKPTASPPSNAARSSASARRSRSRSSRPRPRGSALSSTSSRPRSPPTEGR